MMKRISFTILAISLVLFNAVSWRSGQAAWQSTQANLTQGDLIFSQVFGGSDMDGAQSVAITPDGSTWVLGDTRSIITEGQVYGPTGWRDILLIKYSSTGQPLAIIIMGGSGDDYAGGIAAAPDNTVYISGYTWSQDFPTKNSYDASFNGGNADGFVAHITSGGGLSFSTFIGGNDWDEVDDVAVKPDGGLVICGATTSPNFPASADAADPSYNGYFDAFVAELLGNGYLQRATYFGGTDAEFGRSVAISPDQSIYLTGEVEGRIPTTPGAYDSTPGGGRDGYVTRFSADLKQVIYATQLGGSAMEEYAESIAAGSDNSAYVVGWTTSGDFPRTSSALRTSLQDSEGFLTRLKPDGSGLLYSTFLGGNSSDDASSVWVAADGTVTVAGSTSSTNFPTTANAYSQIMFGSPDGFVLRLADTGLAPGYASYIGDEMPNSIEGLAVDPDGQVCVAGTSTPASGFSDLYTACLRMGASPKYGITGQVVDGANKGLFGALVSDDHGHSVQTDATGSFAFNNLEPDVYTLSVKRGAYQFSQPTRVVDLTGGSQTIQFTGSPGPWTLLFYLDGDNNLDGTYPPILNRLQAAADNPNVRVIVLWDRQDSHGSAYFELMPSSGGFVPSYVEGVNYLSKTELNMGDPQTLTDFVNWARQNYPSTYTGLILSDHGSGLGGGMWDETDSDDHLTVAEMRDSLSTITNNGSTPLHLLYLDACLMGMMEDAYEFRNYAQYYVAVESIQWAYFEPYSGYLKAVTNSSTPSNLAQAFAQSYADAATQRGDPYTISAIDLSRMDALAAATDQLGTQLSTNMSTQAGAVLNTLDHVQRYDMNGDGLIDSSDMYVDLYSFADLIQGYSTLSEVVNASKEVKSALNVAVIANHFGSGRGWNHDNSHGLTIFFPDRRSSYYRGENYSYAEGSTWGFSSGQALAGTTHQWGSMLASYFQESDNQLPDQPTPPDPRPRSDDNAYLFMPMLVR
jgi:Clostripain family/Carboxypeptidase regulatory-like domain